MSKLLVFKGNYADEFDFVAGTIVDEWYTVDSPELAELDLDREHEVYFGTNEFVTVTIRELVTQCEIVELETDTELKLAKLLGTPFGRIFDVIGERLQEIEDRRQDERNQKRWDKLPEETKELYRTKRHQWSSLPYVPYFRDGYAESRVKSDALYQEVKELWSEMDMEGYPNLPQ